MASEQAAYHGGLEGIKQELVEQQGLTETAKEKVAVGEAERYRAVDAAYVQLLNALGELATYHRDETTPANAAAHHKAQEISKNFSAAFPNTEGRAVLRDIHHKLVALHHAWRTERNIVAGVQGTIDYALRQAQNLGNTGLVPVDNALTPIPAQYDGLIEQNQDAIRLIDIQSGLS